MKKICTRIIGSSLLLLGLVGCGSEKTKGTESGEKVVKLRMMGYSNENLRATYLRYLKEKLPENIVIEFEFIPLDNFDDVLSTQLQAGQGPDIIELGGQTKLFARANYLLDLSGEEFIKKYADAGIQPYMMDGKVYAAPLQSWYEGIFYNRDLFKENGLEVPKTWDEFLSVHKKLQEKGIKPQTMGAQSYEPMMKQSIGVVNAQFYSNPTNRAFDDQFNTGEGKLAQAWLSALNEWNKIIQDGYLTEDMLGLSYDQALEEFATGRAAMWQSGPWSVDTLKEKNPNLKFGMFPFPGTDPNKAGWLVGGPGSALGINAKSKHIKEALKVLELTATEEAQKALVKDNAGSSFLKGVEIDLGDIYRECVAAFKEGNVYAPWTASWLNGNAVTQGYGKSLQEVLAGTKTVEEALNDADGINNNLLESMR